MSSYIFEFLHKRGARKRTRAPLLLSAMSAALVVLVGILIVLVGVLVGLIVLVGVVVLVLIVLVGILVIEILVVHIGHLLLYFSVRM